MSPQAKPERVRELLAAVLAPSEIGVFSARAGIAEVPLAAPSSVQSAIELVRLARSERWTVLPIGAGSKLARARPPARVELVLSSRNLHGVSAFEPKDGTLTAQAGTPWSELEACVRATHHLSPQLPAAEPGTLGGALGEGTSGFDRLRYGPLRHQILGLVALHADGSVVKSGGRVVKNVTGYDLHRLWCGSRGTLCFLLEATLRLYPAPPEIVVLRVRSASRAEGVARAQALLHARVAPLAAVLHEHTGAPELSIVLAGRAEAVASELALARAAIASAGAANTSPGEVEVVEGDEARRVRAELCARELPADGPAPLWFSCRPSRLTAALARVEELAQTLGLAPRLACHPLLANASLWFPLAELTPARVAALARGLAGGELALHWRGLTAETWNALAPVAASPAGALMQRLKQALDPEGLFVQGRFHDGL